MRTRALFAVIAIALLLGACAAEQESTSLVTNAGTAPYYTNLDDALAAASPDQFVVAEFYTDW